MPDIVVCYKWVLDEVDIVVNSDLSLNTERAAGKISEYDRNAIEAGVQLKDALGGKLYGLTFGKESSRPALKDAVSRGLDEVIWVHAEAAEGADEGMTCGALVEGLKQVAELGVVICGDGSSDNYARQLPSRLGAALDIPVVTSVCRFGMEDGKLVAVRKLDDDEETVEAALPVVVSVLPALCAAPVPGLRSVMMAGKKPVIEVDVTDSLPPRKSETRSTKGYEMKRKNIMLEGETKADAVAQLLIALEKEGVF